MYIGFHSGQRKYEPGRDPQNYRQPQKKAGFVHVKAGAGGAYLRKELDEITLLDVYRAVEVVEKGELFNFHGHPNPACPVGANIESVLRTNMLEAQSAMERQLAQVTLNQLVTELSKKTAL